MAGRRIEGEVDARTCLAAVRASGLTARQWCGRAGVDARSLNAWRMNMERGPGAAARAGEAVRGRAELVEVVVGRAAPWPR